MNMAQEENKQLIAATDNVIAFPSKEAYDEIRKENEDRRAKAIERTNALVPYFRIWVKRTLGRDAKEAYRGGGKWSITFSIKKLADMLLAPDAVNSFKKQMESEKITPPELPTEVTSWELMKAFMQTIRRYNYGMKMGSSGYMILCHSDHKISQTISTGEDTWSEPTELTFELWRVANGDYEQPWKLEWIQDPQDSTKRVQIKVYIKTASVLKPWENKAEPALVEEDERNFKLLQMKEGDSHEFRLAGEHETEQEQDLNDFLGLVTRVSESNNIRFDIRTPEPSRVIIAHTGKLYR